MALTFLSCIPLKYGLGRHISTETSGNINMALKFAFASRLVYQFTLSATKFSLGAFYLRVFQDRTSRRITYTLIGFIAIYSLPLELLTALQCRPISGAWSMLPANCIDLTAILITSAVCNIVTDTLLLSFIIFRIGMSSDAVRRADFTDPYTAPLKIELRQKAILLALISLSLLVIVAAIIRVVLVSQVPLGTDGTCKD